MHMVYTWQCGCGEVEFAMTGQPHIHLTCMCDDCHVRTLFAQSKEQVPGTFNRFRENGGVGVGLWYGSTVKCTKGEDKLVFFRAAIKNQGTESANDTTKNLSARCANCGTLAVVFGVPGCVGFLVGPDLDRMQDGAAMTFPPPIGPVMAKYCDLTGIAKPAEASDFIPPCALICKFMPLLMFPCLTPGRGTHPLMQQCPPGATHFCGTPVEYVGIDTIKALNFPPWRAS
eukprot:NODE_14798_length_1085_cov_3.870564.p2 GENE.NODE_14798_length_1085_cov_3.870564~~NODE_14798_length_1085_cov_3.870564.p2  ORF type:complete len:255 (-),score=37.18 NODE_14798_length_1085_cov_3.870564:319-1005(-)